MKEIDEELKAAQAQVQEARTEAPRRSRKLAEELNERFRPIRRELKQAFDDMFLEFQQATDDRKVLAEPDAVINRLVREMVDAQGGANRDLSKVVDDVAAGFSERCPSRYPALAATRDRAALAVAASIDMPARRFASFRTVWGGGTAAGAAV